MTNWIMVIALITAINQGARVAREIDMQPGNVTPYATDHPTEITGRASMTIAITATHANDQRGASFI